MSSLSDNTPILLPELSNTVSAWFLAPKGENESYLREFIQTALNIHVEGRKSYFPGDASVVPEQVQASEEFQGIVPMFNAIRWFTNFIIKGSMALLRDLVIKLGPRLAKHSVPFWNPRYNAHMNMDVSMPGVIGYFLAMLCNYVRVLLLYYPY